jgi:hypothetical protein
MCPEGSECFETSAGREVAARAKESSFVFGLNAFYSCLGS